MYRIKIEKVETVEVMNRSYEKIADTGNKNDGGTLYGYVEHPTVEQKSTVVLLQEAEELDLTEVIKAVNNIK